MMLAAEKNGIRCVFACIQASMTRLPAGMADCFDAPAAPLSPPPHKHEGRMHWGSARCALPHTGTLRSKQAGAALVHADMPPYRCYANASDVMPSVKVCNHQL